MNHAEYRAMQRRFWEYLEELTGARDAPYSNHEAYVLFNAIEQAFTPCPSIGRDLPVNQELVQYLAGWGSAAIRGENIEDGVLGPPHPNHFLNRAFDGFFVTVREAIKEKRGYIWKRDGQSYFGCLKLPKWMVDHFTDEAAQEEAHRREYRKRYPSEPYLAHSQEQ